MDSKRKSPWLLRDNNALPKGEAQTRDPWQIPRFLKRLSPKVEQVIASMGFFYPRHEKMTENASREFP